MTTDTILVFNAGSATLKFALYRFATIEPFRRMPVSGAGRSVAGQSWRCSPIVRLRRSNTLSRDMKSPLPDIASCMAAQTTSGRSRSMRA